MERPVSRDVATPDAFAQSALNTILGDVQQEIAAGSNATYYTDANGTLLGSVYLPFNPTAAVPALALKGQQAMVTTFAANLVKRSAYGQNFFPGNGDAGAANYNNGNTAATVDEPSAPGATPSPYTAPFHPPSNRAANVASTVSSQNGLAVLPARWNKALLLPKAAGNLTDPTTVAPDSASFVVPDWVLVARDGSNPTFWSPSLLTSASNPASVVGRYAYTIYDEGGLLDLSGAGYTSGTDARQVGYKDTLASADLTQAGLSQAQIDSLVNWRNGHPFGGRQDLLSFFTQTLATNDSTRAALQNSLQYFGIFSRGLKQPSYAPVSRVGSATNQNPRPLIQPSTASSSQPGGGNNVGDNYTTAAQQDVFSPSLLSVRAEAVFTRNDGATAAVLGEPLVKSRFALQRLAWLTYLGPSATRNLSDVDMQQLVNTYGITAAYLQKGTAANIQSYFGLVWDATNHCWKYNVHNGGSANTGTGAIMKLPDIADLKTREPDFFELLKASVDPGSLAKASTNSKAAEGAGNAGVYPLDFQFTRDTSLDAAIIQLGANIIDQFDVDGYSTHIIFDDGSGRPAREFRGVENLPYLYRVRTGSMKVREPIPAYSNNASQAGSAANPDLHSGSASGYTAKPLLDTGVGVIMALPDIWNPHDESCSLGNPRPSAFQLVAYSTDPDTFALGGGASNFITAGYAVTTVGSYRGGSNVAAYGPSSGLNPPAPGFSRTPTPTGGAGTPMTGGNASSTNSYNTPFPINSTNSSTLTFTVPDNTLFREPTLLGKPDPSGPSQLTMKITNPDVIGVRHTNGSAAFTSGGIQPITNLNPLELPTAPVATQVYCGIYLGMYPLRWVGPRYSGSDPRSTGWVYTDADMEVVGTPIPALTYDLQYMDQFGKIVTYDEKYLDTDTSFQQPLTGDLIQPKGGEYAFADPRTARFGSPTEANIADPAHYRAPLDASTTTWLDTSGNLLSVVTERPDISSGFGSNFRGSYSGFNDWGAYAAPGLHTQNIDTAAGVNGIFFQTGLLAQNNPYFHSDGLRFSGDFPGVGTRDANFWSDPDGVVRRASGGYVAAGSATGQPLATSTTFNAGRGTPTAQSQSRPIILNRPFRSVAELGYVFSGNPWKNVDFSTPESGYSELLDVFCVNDTNPPAGLVAGTVNVNTRQPAVLQSVLAGAYTDEENGFSPSPSWSTTPLASSDASAISQLLTARSSTAPLAGPDVSSGPQPLQNIGDLVGRWSSLQTISGTFTPSLGNVHNVDGSKSYDGFSADLSTLTTLTAPQTLKIPRLRESAVRALANVGNTRVWNLMIDVIAQTGEYSASATGLGQFTVEGSQRYWLHVAVDRLTGNVLDQSLEAVPEAPPTDVSLMNSSVAENQVAGTVVGSLSGVGPNPSSTYTYALVGGTGSGDNASFTIANNTLQTAASLQYLNKSTYNIRLRVIDQDSLSFEKTVAVNVLPSAYTQWKVANFGGQANDPMVAGDLIDADHDGTVNLVEYALGTSPLTADIPGMSLQRDNNGIEFNYTRRSSANDVTVHAYWSSDLTKPGGWSTTGITETMLSDDGTLQRWQATLPLGSSQSAFLRLQVTKP